MNNYLDWLILLLLVISAIQGLWTGFIKALFSLAGWVVGILLAGRFYVPIAEGIFRSEGTPARVAAFAIVLIIVLIVANMIGNLAHKGLSWLGLGLLNRAAGGLFSLVAGALGIAALLALVAKYPFLGLNEVIAGSSLAKLLLDRTPWVLSLLPAEFGSLRSFFHIPVPR